LDRARRRGDLLQREGEILFSRQRRRIGSRPDGPRLREVPESSGGSSFRIADIVSAAESPVKALRPVSIS
jgi:hypothetical protein